MIKPEHRAAELGLELLAEDEAYAEMSNRLLAGWTMLSEHCPISGFPLLRKDNVTWSVRCNMEVKNEGNSPSVSTPAPALALAAPPAAPAPAPAPACNLSSPSSSDSVVDLSRKVASMSSVRTHEEMDERTATTGDVGGSKYDSDKISAELSRLLLAGWKMLEEECPISQACPLMQDKTGRKYSCALEKFVDEKPLTSAMVCSGAASVPQSAPSTVAELPGTFMAEQENEGDDEEDEKFLAQYRNQRMAEVRKSKLDNAALKRQAVGLSPTQDSVYQVVERASASVLSKLNRAQELLITSSDITESTQLAQLIGACAITLKELQKLGNDRTVL